MPKACSLYELMTSGRRARGRELFSHTPLLRDARCSIVSVARATELAVLTGACAHSSPPSQPSRAPRANFSNSGDVDRRVQYTL